jgi:hypothetical protein
MKRVGRRAECDTLDRLVEVVDAWYSQASVMCGQPNVGTTASIQSLVRRKCSPGIREPERK